MTTKEWNAGIEYLENGKNGDFVEYNGRTVVIGDMIGGAFELYDGEEFCGVTDVEWRAMVFLKNGKIFASRR